MALVPCKPNNLSHFHFLGFVSSKPANPGSHRHPSVARRAPWWPGRFRPKIIPAPDGIR
jgi:hypothetical protein